MAVFQCKNCGANLHIDSSKTTIICEYCGTMQTPFEGAANWTAASEETLLQRAFMALEDREFQKADEFCERVLDISPHNPQAYLGKLLAEFQLPNKESLRNCNGFVDCSKNYRRLMQFADQPLKEEIDVYMQDILRRRLLNAISEHADAKAGIQKQPPVQQTGDDTAGCFWVAIIVAAIIIVVITELLGI